MKHALLLFLFICSLATAQAQNNYRNGELTIQSGQPVMIAIDNRLYDASGTSLTIGNIPRGNHNLKIYRVHNRRGELVRGRLLFETIVKLKPGQRLVGEWDGYYNTLRLHAGPINYQDYNAGGNGRENRDYRDNNSGRDRQYDDDLYTRPDNRDDREDGRMAYQLTTQQLNDLEAIIAKLITDTDKTARLKEELGMKTYKVDQLERIAGWLTFESDKLDFLKWAYTNTEDKANYARLNKLFRFESSKKELTDYVLQQRP